VAAQIRRASASGAAPTPSQPQAQAQPVVEIIAARMLNFFKRIAYRDILTQLMVVSRPLLLQYMPSVPRHLSDACKAAASGTPSYYLAFPPIPLPTGFPIHRVRPHPRDSYFVTAKLCYNFIFIIHLFCFNLTTQ
jgi:hypothetical protein